MSHKAIIATDRPIYRNLHGEILAVSEHSPHPNTALSKLSSIACLLSTPRIGRLAVLLAFFIGLLFLAPAPLAAQQAEELMSPGEIAQTAADTVDKIKEFFQDHRTQAGIVAVLIVLGLTLWLLGARAGRLLFAILLATAGVIPGMYLAQALELPSLWPGAVAGGLFGMLIGVFIFKVGIMLVGMCISTILALGIFTVVAMESADQQQLIDTVQESLVQTQDDPVQPTAYDTSQLGTYPQPATAPDQSIIDLLSKYRNGLLVTVVAGLATGLLLQLFARSFMLTLTTSFLGTTMVLAGVYLGLAFKGKKADELLGLKPATSMVIFLVMLGLGMLAQLTMTRKQDEPEPEQKEEE